MKKRSYISLFSSAGVGCYGFKKENFHCVSTNELLKDRLEIQKFNNKCDFEKGYILGDIRLEETKNKLRNNINKWKNDSDQDIDVVIATPPCQGMSTANYKKNNELKRNSLVVEAINLVEEISPRIFIFENVKAFMKTICTDIDGIDKEIGEAIINRLNSDYNIYSRVINFKDYGVPSSRPRNILIGTRRDMKNVSPLNIFPSVHDSINLNDAIGDLRSISSMGDIDPNDIYHFFRPYPKYMREWISPLKEKESAFSNPEPLRPYKIKDGERVLLKSGHLGNKFRRLSMEQPGACIATRNDQLASQDTIHPIDDRVLSIRELMKLMTIPQTFRWTNKDFDDLNNYSFNDKKSFLKKNELKIRRSIGEAVPTYIFEQIAKNINQILDFEDYMVNKNLIYNHEELMKKNIYVRMYEFEKKLDDINSTGSFYTPQSVIFETLSSFELSKNEMKRDYRVLEPTVGTGNFLIQLAKIINTKGNVTIDLVDFNENAINFVKNNIQDFNFPSNFKINFYVKNIINFPIEQNYDLIIGNPPYFKLSASEYKIYRKTLLSNSKSKNIFTYVMDKLYRNSKQILILIPKTFLMSPQYNFTKKNFESYGIKQIIDFGVKAFDKVFVEIIAIHFILDYRLKIKVLDKINDEIFIHEQKEIFYRNLWLIYVNKFFKDFLSKLTLDVFDFYRDRQITNKYLSDKGNIWVLRSKNILDNGEIIHIDGYDKFIDSIDDFVIRKHYGNENIIVPNFTYNIRASKLPKKAVCNGSIVILIPKISLDLIGDISYYSGDEYREYYRILKNRSKFTINIDSNTIYYIGVMKGENY